MVQSYKNINKELARQIKLLMTDVDGTLTASGDISPPVRDAISRLEESGITVGLISGRTLPRLESMAENLGITGPIIAENGGVAKLKANGELVDLGYSRLLAIKEWERLKEKFPDCLKGREDNKDRLVDVVFWCQGMDTEKLSDYLEDTHLLDSGYILHLVQKEVNKGTTLMRLLREMADRRLSPEEVLVVGDSTADLSLFHLFPHSVLIVNPRLLLGHREVMQEAAEYISKNPFGDGFVEVALHITNLRSYRKIVTN